MYSTRTSRAKQIWWNDKTEFFQKFNRAASTITKDLKIVMKDNPNKPICFIAGSRMYKEAFGHAQVVILVPKDDGYDAVIKDSLPLKDACVKLITNEVLKGLKIKRALLIAKLPHERDITYSECLRESYQVIGDVLDGNPFWKNECKGCTRKYKNGKEVPVQ